MALVSPVINTLARAAMSAELLDAETEADLARR
ncbi:MAG: hypothetical protein ACJAW4_002179, partial [Paracoccaceae bacterium]